MKNRIFICVVFVVVLLGVVGCSVIHAPTSDDANNPDSSLSDNTTIDEVDFTELTYCAFGDSITYGANYLDRYNQMENPYPKLVAQSLGLSSYTNAGVSGATLVSNVPNRDCVANIIDSYTSGYDIISVMAGVNDFSVSTPLGTFGDTDLNSVYGSLDYIAKTLKNKNPNAFIFFMTPYKKGDGTIKNANGYTLLDIATAVKTVANKYAIPVLDMYEEGKYEYYGMYGENSDQLHPNQDFVTMYTAPQIVRFIRANYKGK